MNFLLPSRRTELIVCQAMSIAITVVLPAPVASLSAKRGRPGFDRAFAASRWSRNFFPAAWPGATSVNQISVSIASTWQKNGRKWLNLWCRQCSSRRAVSGVTPHEEGLGSSRQRST